MGCEGGGEVAVIEAMKKAQDLVSHKSQYPLANSKKLAAAQMKVSPEGVLLVFIQGVITHWWSMYMMLQRFLVFKPAIINVFSEEFCNKEQQDKRTLLENLALSDNDFEVITAVVHVLAPFKVAQEALEGEKIVNLSVSPMTIHKPGRTLLDNLERKLQAKFDHGQNAEQKARARPTAESMPFANTVFLQPLCCQML